MKNIIATKIFCAWDYGIASAEAATLKHSALHHELRELINETDKKSSKIKFATRMQTFFIRLTSSALIFLSIGGICYLIWYLLDEKVTTNPILTAVTVNVVLIVFPQVLKFFSKYEDYKSPKMTLFMNLSRLFVLEMAIIIILIIYWTGTTKIEVR